MVAALEAMSRGPEAAIYDQEQKEILKLFSEPPFADWPGELELDCVEAILAKARLVAAAN